MQSSEEEQREHTNEDGSDASGEEFSEIDFDEYPEFAALPTLDSLRKCRREVMRTINTSRG